MLIHSLNKVYGENAQDGGIKLRQQDFQIFLGSQYATMIMYWRFNSWQIKLQDNLNQGSYVYWKETKICLDIQFKLIMNLPKEVVSVGLMMISLSIIRIQL